MLFNIKGKRLYASSVGGYGLSDRKVTVLSASQSVGRSVGRSVVISQSKTVSRKERKECISCNW